MILRDYQIEIAKNAAEKLKSLKIIYFAMQTRTGKTLTALQTAQNLNVRNVLFLTKKKAVQNIISDYHSFDFNFRLTVTNYEQADKYTPEFDMVIVDEASNLGAYPKPSLRTKMIKELVGDNYLVLMSATPSSESYSMLFHQFWISEFSPFRFYKNFYRWADDFVTVIQKKFNGVRINDYSRANKEKIMEVLNDYFITFTQEQAGFNQEVFEKIQHVKMKDSTYNLIKVLLRDRIYKDIICDSPVKLQSKTHQIFSGTVKNEDGTHIKFDDSKINYIKEHYKGKKIAIYYMFIAEGEMLKANFDTTDDYVEFNNSVDKVYISQLQSGSMGIDLRTADYLLMYNIHFSSTIYWQVRNRIQSKDRTTVPMVHWIFSENGIEDKVYKAVVEKKNYTVSYYKRDYKIKEARAC